MPLGEFFYRESDRIEADCVWLEIDGERLEEGRLSICHSVLSYGSREWTLASLPEAMPIRAGAAEVILPREAMGFGDVKFLACIGAFLGWKGVLFSLFGGAVVGAVVGVVMMTATRGRHGPGTARLVPGLGARRR